MEYGKGVKIWESSGYKVPYIPYTYKHVFGLEAFYWEPEKAHRFILDHWHFSIPIVIGYVIAIHAIQAFMRPLKPLSLNRPLVLWNAALAVFSLIGTIRVGEESLNVLLTRDHGVHDVLCISFDPAGICSLWTYLFILSKVAELFDTVFVVLRKRKLLFLHWYHHASVLVVCWHGAQQVIAPSRTFILMNFFVHTFMYTYYAITASGIRLSRTLAMFVTTIQNIQMLGGVLITLYVSKVRWIDRNPCHMTDKDLCLCFFVYLTFGILFCRFFINAYLKKTDKAVGDAKQEEKKLN